MGERGAWTLTTRTASWSPNIVGNKISMFVPATEKPPHRPGAAAGAHFCEAEDQVLGP